MDPRVGFAPRFAGIERPRIFVDNSVFSGARDPGFAAGSTRFLDAAEAGQIELLISAAVRREIDDAPKNVRKVFYGLPRACWKEIEITDEVFALRDAYIEARVVTWNHEADATHVAAATVARADAIVSWNQTELVKANKIRGFNRVNRLKGYGELDIIKPTEVFLDEMA